MPSGPEGPKGSGRGNDNVHRLRTLTGRAAETSDRTEPHDPDFVQEALTLDAEIGVMAASRELGVSPTLIANWKSKAIRDQRRALAEFIAAGGELDSLPTSPWQDAREAVGDKLGNYASIIADQTLVAMLDQNAQLVRSGAIAIGVMIDRAQVLTGGRQVKQLTPAERETKIAATIERIRRRKDAAEAAAQSEGDTG